MDNKEKTQPLDDKRVNVNEEYELRYWSGKFGVSTDELKAAVRKVGTMAADLERELGKPSKKP